MFCPNCGVSVDESESTCHKCGYALIPNKGVKHSRKYCRNCGQEIDDSTIICPHCAAKQTNGSENRNQSTIIHDADHEKGILLTPWGEEVTGDKSVALGLILSIIIPGLGTMYSGRVLRGLALFFGIWVLLAISIYIVHADVDFDSASMVVGGVVFLLLSTFSLYIYSVYDGFRNCEIIHDLYDKATGFKS